MSRQLVALKNCIEEVLSLEPEVKVLYPDLALPNHVILILRRIVREITLKLIEEEAERYE
ncbi:MAG: hypothetical protein QW692_04200 [Nitrososphaerota archaeon]